MSLPEQSADLVRFPAGIREAYRGFSEKPGIPTASSVAVAALRHYQSSERAGAPVDDADRLVEDLGYDSLAVAELVFVLEDLLSITVANVEISELRTVGDVRRFVARKLASAPATL